MCYRIGDVRVPCVRSTEPGGCSARAEQTYVGVVAQAPRESLHQRQAEHDEHLQLGGMLRADPAQK